MNRKILLIFCLMGCFALTGFSQIQKLEVQTPFSFSVYSLNNGLTVILSENHSLPLVTVVCAYKVGSAFEQDGKTGMALLLENLMFLGSRNIGPMQHIRYIHRVGGELNAITSWDRTIFSQTVPSNQLPLVLWLESDRMKSLNLNYTHVEETKTLLVEMVKNQKIEDPFRESLLKFNQLLYPEFAYHHPLTGNEDDLKNITLNDVRDFYETFYKPNNAVLCITGDIDEAQTLRLVRKYFQTINPSKKRPPAPVFKGGYKQARSVEVMTNKDVSTPGFRLGYRIGSSYSNDFYILSMIDYLLFFGKSSRLYQRLVARNKLALRLNGGIEQRIDLASFKFFVLSNNEATKDIAQKALFSEINRLKSTLVSDRELKKIKNMFKSDYMGHFNSTEKRAMFLTRYFLSGRDLSDLAKELDRFLSVSTPDIVGIMNRYFTDNYVLIDIRTQ
ncbi:MAG: peptidase M16 [Candidatus Aminicenantes bacterium]|nr:peptidase M16 [Candidatus Aminicenantes bacterium]